MISFTSAKRTTHVMINFRATPDEKLQLGQLVTRLDQAGRDARYRTRGGYNVSTSDVIRWGLEALRRELDAAQAVADSAEYNRKHPGRKTVKKGVKK